MRSTPRGTTLAELVISLALLGLIAAIATPSISTINDRLNVRAAAQDIVFALSIAREAALHRGDYATFAAGPSGRVRVWCVAETLFARDLAARRGVSLSVTRDTVVYAPTGLGWGAANTTIVVSRGRRADTITTSRLGRVKWR